MFAGFGTISDDLWKLRTNFGGFWPGGITRRADITPWYYSTVWDTEMVCWLQMWIGPRGVYQVGRDRGRNHHAPINIGREVRWDTAVETVIGTGRHWGWRQRERNSIWGDGVGHTLL